MLRVRFTDPAWADLDAILDWSEHRFGPAAAQRYDALLDAALRDIASAPDRFGVGNRDDLSPGVRTYHLRHSRRRAGGETGTVHRPRHLFVFRLRNESTLEVLRILHDAMEIERHLPARSRAGRYRTTRQE